MPGKERQELSRNRGTQKQAREHSGTVIGPAIGPGFKASENITRAGVLASDASGTAVEAFKWGRAAPSTEPN